MVRLDPATRSKVVFTLLMAATSSVVVVIPYRGTLAAQGAANKPGKQDPDLRRYGIYRNTVPRPSGTAAAPTTLPLELQTDDRIALVGNTLFERARLFGYFESMLQQSHPDHRLVVRNLAWSADTTTLQPRPDNFADQDQHLFHERADVILAAYGFNESFAGPDGLASFRQDLVAYVQSLKTHAYNGQSGPRVVLVSPIAAENVAAVAAGELNNQRLAAYTEVMQEVAVAESVGFVDVFTPSREWLRPADEDLTLNGVHLTDLGYRHFSRDLFQGLFDRPAPKPNELLCQVVVDKNRQYFRRYRPLNTFYYTGDRNKTYGYLDFLPAMRSFDSMVANRQRRMWEIVQGSSNSPVIDDSQIPPLPVVPQSRGANRWMSAADELASFRVDPRFEVNLFAGEEEFPDIAAPIQMRWDTRGRLWVACSTTYPHVYPGNEPCDKLVILTDTDGDGRADTSTVFADDLHIPLSFEFGDGGVYVSDMPHLTFLKDTDGDGRADVRRRLLTGFGTEDSHHALHDFAWTPDGELLFRESIFHHSQVETPYGPVRQRNSGWFRFDPRTQRLTSFGTYPSTNPWGVTFDDWGQHVASHPIYAAAFHSLDPPYPRQHPKPAGLRAYSGTCGQEFVDFDTFPSEMKGGYVKARYKPTNRLEFHRWVESEFGFDEQYVGDIIFSENLSFIPVDIRFGPRGALYVCDWYNPIKGHMQYSLRDDRRDRHSGRIWRITTKGKPLQEPPRIADAPVEDLLELLKRQEYRYRYWAKRELRERDPEAVRMSLDQWIKRLDPADPRYRHHQLEALWAYRTIGRASDGLLRELLGCEDPHARAAAMRQLRYRHTKMDDAIEWLRRGANDPRGIVRMEAAIAASHIGSRDALSAMLDVFYYPMGDHLQYAVTCALGSHTLRRHWENDSTYDVPLKLKRIATNQALREPTPSATESQFDTQDDLAVVNISCVPERMQYTLRSFAVRPGQPIKLVFTNPDATDHNLVFVRPGTVEEVGMAANAMARDPKFANSNFIPAEKQDLILRYAPMIGPTRRSRVHVLRFEAPTEPGVYPYVCTFPGHWIVMQGRMVVADSDQAAEQMLADADAVEVVQVWTLDDFDQLELRDDETSLMRGMNALVKAQCLQCHAMGGHGVALGPDLAQVVKKRRGTELLKQLLEPSMEIAQGYQSHLLVLEDGSTVSGLIVEETDTVYRVVTNPLTPDQISEVPKKAVDEKVPSKVSTMPEGLLNILTRQEIEDLLAYLQAGGYQLPDHLEHHHGQKK